MGGGNLFRSPYAHIVPLASNRNVHICTASKITRKSLEVTLIATSSPSHNIPHEFSYNQMKSLINLITIYREVEWFDCGFNCIAEFDFSLARMLDSNSLILFFSDAKRYSNRYLFKEHDFLLLFLDGGWGEHTILLCIFRTELNTAVP